MQAVGMVNDHLVDCFRYREIQRLRIRFIFLALSQFLKEPQQSVVKKALEAYFVSLVKHTEGCCRAA